MFKTLSVVGPTNGSWGQTLVVGKLYAVIEIIHSDNASVIGHTISEQLTKEYEAHHDINLTKLKTILQSLTLFPHTHITLAAVKNNILYVVNHGDGTALIKRGDTCTSIVSGNKAVSGKLLDGDRVILCSPAFLKVTNDKDCAALFETSPFEDLKEQLASMIHQEEAVGAAALIGLYELVPHQPTSQQPKIIDRFRQMLQKIKRHHQPPTPDEPMTKKKKITIAIGLLLLIFFAASLLVNGNKRQTTITSNEIAILRQTTNDKIREGNELIELNALQARRTLSETKQTLQDARANFKEGSSEYKEIETLMSEVDDVLAKAQRIFKLNSLPLFFDLAWIKDHATGTRMALFENTLAILDPVNQSIYSINVASKKATLVGSGSVLQKATAVAAYDTMIAAVDNENKSIVGNSLQELAKGDGWQTIIDATAYAANIYLLDTNGTIWKYPKVDDALTSGRNYLAADVHVDFQQATSLAIDGNVWVLVGNTIKKFNRGAPDAFTIKEEEPTDAIALYTHEDIPRLFVLDKMGKLLVYDKNGNYQEQYQSLDLTQATDVVVSSSLKKALILSGGKILAIDVTW